VHDADMLLRAADIARILEGDPRMARFKQHGQHLAPQAERRDGLGHAHFAARRFGFISRVGLLESATGQIVQIGYFSRTEERPVAAFHHALHEEVWNPVCGVHVVRAATVVTGVLA